uniref:Uncharacterized protein n=1 Tax=Oryza rufipogon TaxID=4529 RepID=A0A0E0P4P2_ORYRU
MTVAMAVAGGFSADNGAHRRGPILATTLTVALAGGTGGDIHRRDKARETVPIAVYDGLKSRLLASNKGKHVMVGISDEISIIVSSLPKLSGGGLGSGRDRQQLDRGATQAGERDGDELGPAAAGLGAALVGGSGHKRLQQG